MNYLQYSGDKVDVNLKNNFMHDSTYFAAGH